MTDKYVKEAVDRMNLELAIKHTKGNTEMEYFKSTWDLLEAAQGSEYYQGRFVTGWQHVENIVSEAYLEAILYYDNNRVKATQELHTTLTMYLRNTMHDVGLDLPLHDFIQEYLYVEDKWEEYRKKND